MNKKDLDLIALNIEFLLISVVQGVAFSALASAAYPLLSLEHWQYWPVIISEFFLILIFWSQAIMHSLSFVDWPIDLSHSFLYFLASFIEFVSFQHLTDPGSWFFLTFIFFVVVWWLYRLDLHIVKKKRAEFSKDEKKKKLFEHIIERQEKERRMIGPLGVGYCLFSFLLTWIVPDILIISGWHMLLSSIWMGILGYGLWRSVVSYEERMKRITACMSSD